MAAAFALEPLRPASCLSGRTPIGVHSVASSRSVARGRLAVVNDFLVTYLDSIDEDLIAYPDEHEELPVEVARRMRDSAVALLDGDMHPSRLSSSGTTGIT